MVTYAPLAFPAGSMLAGRRRATATPGRYGSLEPEQTVPFGPIGPCSLLTSPSASNGEHEQGTAQLAGSLGAPVGTDCHIGDELQLPSGEWVRVTAEPTTPTNPWTGWQPYTRIPFARQRTNPQE